MTRPAPLLWALLLCGWCAALPWPAAADSSEPPPPCLWADIIRELQATAVSPVRGSWEGYLLAAGFLGAGTMALHQDRQWYAAAQDHRTAWQDKVMPVASLFGDGFFHAGAYAALYQFGGPREQQAAAQAFEGLFCVAAVSTLCKGVFTATRPTEEASARQWFTLRFGDNSFPSGHAMTAFCAAAILGDAYQAAWLAYPLAGLVAYSRVYNQNHWPSDVIFGAGLGILIGQAVLAVHQESNQEPSVRFTLAPGDQPGVMVTWLF